MKFTSLVLVTLFSMNAFAAANTEENFIKKVYGVLESNNYQAIEVDPQALSKTQAAGLLKAATDESYVWADTILEGDYMLKDGSEVVVNTVEKILNGKAEFVAYRIEYSQAAFDVGACDVDYELMENNPAAFEEYAIENCTSGNISSAAYVSPDFQFHFRDENSIEDFSD